MTAYKAPELTRGNVKLAMKNVAATSSDLWQVPPDKILFLDGFNLRQNSPEYEAHIEQLAKSIQANGFYQDKPISGYVAVDGAGEQQIFATEGHSRVIATLRAIKMGAPIETIPMVVKPKGTTMEDLTVALVTSNEGKPFTPYEKGLAIKRLLDMGLPISKIATRLGFSGQYCSDMLDLVGAPKQVRDLVVAGTVSATTAVSSIKKHGAKAGEQLAKAVEVAKAAGKSKVTKKHTVRPSLRLKGSTATAVLAGKNRLSVLLDAPLDVDIPLGMTVKLVLVDDDSL